MKQIIFSPNAHQQLFEWSQIDLKTLKKVIELISELKNDPFKGKGKPEPLKHNLKGFWSRRITDEHRLVYRINEHGDLLIHSCKGHYSDK